MPSALPDNSHRSLMAGEAETDELQHRSRRLEEGEFFGVQMDRMYAWRLGTLTAQFSCASNQ